MPDEFLTPKFKLEAIAQCQISERTATNYLREMVKCKAIESISRGRYRKLLNVVTFEDNQSENKASLTSLRSVKEIKEDKETYFTPIKEV